MSIPAEFREFIPARVPASSHDPLDVLLGDEALLPVRSGMDEGLYARSTHVLLGCPQDEGVARNHGRRGAAGGPDAIRQALYRLKMPLAQDDVQPVRLLDLGDVPQGSLEGMHETLRKGVGRALEDGKTVIVLGGGNDISLPDCRAMAEVFGSVSAVNVDAHLDMRKAGVVHSGTPYRNLLEGGWLKPEHFHEAGIQPWANSPAYLDNARMLGVNVHPLETILEQGAEAFWSALFQRLEERPVFVGLDMDCVRACDAPGVSAPSPVGLSARDVLALARRARRGGRTGVFEICETNPLLDVDGRTARLAALAAYVFMFGA